jgi:hypothetical protein
MRNCQGGYDMVYKELTIETLTSGRYVFNAIRADVIC